MDVGDQTIERLRHGGALVEYFAREQPRMDISAATPGSYTVAALGVYDVAFSSGIVMAMLAPWLRTYRKGQK